MSYGTIIKQIGSLLRKATNMIQNVFMEMLLTKFNLQINLHLYGSATFVKYRNSVEEKKKVLIFHFCLLFLSRHFGASNVSSAPPGS